MYSLYIIKSILLCTLILMLHEYMGFCVQIIYCKNCLQSGNYWKKF